MAQQDDPKSPPLLARLRDATRELLARRTEEGRATEEEADAARGGEALEKATGALTSALERIRHASGVSRFLKPVSRDQVVGVGEHYELVLHAGALGGQLARKVRFSCGERVVGEVGLDEGGAAWLDPVAEEPGLFHVEHEVIGPGEVTLRGRDPERVTRILVVRDAPTVAVDAGLLLGRAPSETAILDRLANAGCVLVYVDLAETDRTQDVRAAIEERGLPDGPLLAYPLAEAEFETLGVDFRAVFAATALRRMRANAVPLVAFVTADRELGRVCEQEGIDALDPGTLQRGLSAEQLGAFERRAREMHERWGQGERRRMRLDAMTGTRAVAGQSCRVELDNRAARETIFEAIDAARRSAHLSFYIFEDDGFTEHLSVRLVRAARRGVHVRLMVDALYSRESVFGMRNPVVEGLRAEPGIEVLASDPIPSTERLEALSLKQRDHRKVVVIDGERAFVSGRNAAEPYYTGFDEVPITDFTPHERIPWMDAHIELEGPLVTDVEAAFVEGWRRNGGEAEEPERRVETEGGSLARLVLHDGARDTNALGAYEAILDSARDHVLLVNDFPIVSSLAAAVRRALGRGVEVVMLTGNGVARRSDGSFFRGPLYREMFEYMTKRRLETLMMLGVQVYELATEPSPLVVARGGVVRPYVHAKIVTADGQVASVGSANLDATASYWEREANVVVEDPEVVGPLEDELRAMIARSYRIDRDSDAWRSESAWRDVVSRLWPDSLYS